MNFKKLTCLASLAMLMPTLAQAADVKVKIVNDERFQRQELVEIDVKDVRAKLGIADDLEQAQARSGGKLGNKGDECAIDAIKMAKF